MRIFSRVIFLILLTSPALAQEQSDPQELYLRATKHMSAEDNKAAVECLKTLIRDHPKHIFAQRAHGDLADALLRLGEREAALKVLDAAASDLSVGEKLRHRYRRSAGELRKHSKRGQGRQRMDVARELKKHMDFIIAILQAVKGIRFPKAFQAQVNEAKALIGKSQQGWKKKVDAHNFCRKAELALKEIDKALLEADEEQTAKLKASKEELLKKMAAARPHLDKDEEFMTILKGMRKWVDTNRPILAKALQTKEQFLRKEVDKTSRILGALGYRRKRPEGRANGGQRREPWPGAGDSLKKPKRSPGEEKKQPGRDF
jgi:tetratricopeptide (TPR) repeat protein